MVAVTRGGPGCAALALLSMGPNASDVELAAACVSLAATVMAALGDAVGDAVHPISDTYYVFVCLLFDDIY